MLTEFENKVLKLLTSDMSSAEVHQEIEREYYDRFAFLNYPIFGYMRMFHYMLFCTSFGVTHSTLVSLCERKIIFSPGLHSKTKARLWRRISIPTSQSASDDTSI